jgi:hypothetical protein
VYVRGRACVCLCAVRVLSCTVQYSTVQTLLYSCTNLVQIAIYSLLRDRALEERRTPSKLVANVVVCEFAAADKGAPHYARRFPETDGIFLRHLGSSEL